MSKSLSPLKYHGGKSYLAKKLRELFPPHKRYCEPFFGGGSVLFSGDGGGVAEFANDLNRELANFWNVLKVVPLFDAFVRLVHSIPFSQEHFARSLDATFDPVERAVAFFIRNRQSRQGLGRDFATPTKRLRRGMNENVSAWLSAVDGLPEFHARLRRVEIRSQPAIDFIRELDSPDTFFYCDPPYVHETRTTTGEYQHEMSDGDHFELLKVLGSIKGKFLLSGYQNATYQLAAINFGWNRKDFEIDNKASGKKVKDKKIESAWMNY